MHSIQREYYFYLLVFVTIATLLFTNPFMRYPYDIWEHLFIIDTHYDNLINMPEVRKIWHHIWAFILDTLGVETTEIFLRAKIIHSVQLMLSLSALFIFSRVVIRLVVQSADRLTINYMAYWATLIWLTIYATQSMHHHQLWILWYSVNYQVTLPLFWYDMALILMILIEPQRSFTKIFYSVQILLLSLFIFIVHPMEFLYLLIHLLLLSLIFIDKIWRFAKKRFLFLFATLLLFLFILRRLYCEQLPVIAKYLTIEKFPKLYDLIIHNGKFLIDNQLNRAYASFNELMVLSLVVGAMLFIYMIVAWRREKKSSSNIRIYSYLLTTSLLVFIPLFVWSAGFASVITKLEVVNRFYYSSSIFILLPIGVYYFLKYFLNSMNIQVFNKSMLVLLVVTFAYSKFYTENQAYYKNIKSLEYSFDNKKVGFHLNESNIEEIGEELKKYENKRDKTKKVLYLARGDIAMVLRYIYHQNVYWGSRKINLTRQNIVDYIKIKKHDPKVNKQEFIIFETPQNFAEYEPYR